MNKTTKELVLQSIIAGVYVAITFVFQSMSFMPQQFRASEFMLILVIIHPKNALGIVLGTLLANVFSSVGAVDIVVGTFATYVSLKLMVRVQLKWLKYLMPSIINGIIIGIMLYVVLDFPLIYSAVSVFVSEAVVTFVPWFIIGDRIIYNERIIDIFG